MPKRFWPDTRGKLDDAATQVQQMLADARRDAETKWCKKLSSKPRSEAATQRERAVADIENAKKVAMAELAGQNFRHGDAGGSQCRWSRIVGRRSR